MYFYTAVIYINNGINRKKSEMFFPTERIIYVFQHNFIVSEIFLLATHLEAGITPFADTATRFICFRTTSWGIKFEHVKASHISNDFVLHFFCDCFVVPIFGGAYIKWEQILVVVCGEDDHFIVFLLTSSEPATTSRRSSKSHGQNQCENKDDLAI